jgi:hypothetical protein
MRVKRSASKAAFRQNMIAIYERRRSRRELPVVVLAWVWGGLFAVNMTLKEASMSRYAEWAEYKRRSWWLLPPVL